MKYKIICLSFCFQTHQPVFIQLLQSAFRIYNCTWPNPAQKASVESCIKTLAEVGRCQVFTFIVFLCILRSELLELECFFSLTIESCSCDSGK